MPKRTFDYMNFALSAELLGRLDELAYHCNRLRAADPSRFGRRMSRRSTMVHLVDHALRNGQALPDLALLLAEHRPLPRPDLKRGRAKEEAKRTTKVT